MVEQVDVVVTFLLYAWSRMEVTYKLFCSCCSCSVNFVNDTCFVESALYDFIQLSLIGLMQESFC